MGQGEGIKIIEVYTETLTCIVTRSRLVTATYILVFSAIAWYALKRAQISD